MRFFVLPISDGVIVDWHLKFQSWWIPATLHHEGRGWYRENVSGKRNLRGWGPDSGRLGRFMKAVKLFSDLQKQKFTSV